MTRVACWLWGHHPLDYRFDADHRIGFVCSRCQRAQVLTELPEIAANKAKAARRAELARDAAIVAERERRVDARRIRDRIHLVSSRRA